MIWRKTATSGLERHPDKVAEFQRVTAFLEQSHFTKFQVPHILDFQRSGAKESMSTDLRVLGLLTPGNLTIAHQ